MEMGNTSNSSRGISMAMGIKSLKLKGMGREYEWLRWECRGTLITSLCVPLYP